jgi:hypothetical protein
MSNITLFGEGAGGGELSRLPRSARKALDQVQAHGLVTAAKVESMAFVSHVAVQEIGLLSMEEALLVERCPHAAGRAKAIVDNFTAAAAGTVARMGYRS